MHTEMPMSFDDIQQLERARHRAMRSLVVGICALAVPLFISAVAVGTVSLAMMLGNGSDGREIGAAILLFLIIGGCLLLGIVLGAVATIMGVRCAGYYRDPRSRRVASVGAGLGIAAVLLFGLPVLSFVLVDLVFRW